MRVQGNMLAIIAGAAWLVPCASAVAVEGTITIPCMTGRPERQPFVGHPGWVDVYARGNSTGVVSRIGPDARIDLPQPSEPVCLIAMFDKIETPPVILPKWPLKPGNLDVPIATAYACAPPGYPEVWDREYTVRGKEFWQTFVAPCTQLYGCSVFDGPKIVWWGNKINVSVHEGGANTDPIIMKDSWEGSEGVFRVSAGHSDHELPRIGWRHGDIELVPGRKYAICVGGYRPHGGEQLDLDAFIRPDKGDGYGPGEAVNHRTRTGGDLCCLLFGNVTGQLVENHIRTEEWEIFIPKRPPTRNWGQTFVAHGVSLAGVSFWGSNGSSDPLTCEVRVLEGGPGGKQIGPVKTARGHDSPDRPIIRYPDIPGQLPGCEAYYSLPCDSFQIGYLPDEVPLEPDRTYYIQLSASEPLMMYADGEYYYRGYAHYEGLKAEQMRKHATFHSTRWTLAMNIVTYENPGGVPTDFVKAVPRPPPGPDGNLIVNGGAETGDFSWWQVGADPVIDPSTHLPEPRTHSGQHRFGISIGWNKADMYQYQEVPGIAAGQSYVAGMWASHRDGTDEFAQVLWCDGPFGGDEHLLAQTEQEASPQWKHYEGEPFAPTKPTVTIIVRYKHTKATNIASIHVDDVYLKKAK